MQTTIDSISIGTSDLARSRHFYEEGLGGSVVDNHDGGITVTLGAAASRIVLCPWDELAADAGVPADSIGFRAFTLSYILDSAEGVDQVLEAATRCGGRVSKDPKNAPWGYSAYVTDPSGHLWKVASSKHHPLLGGKQAPPAAEQGPPSAKEVPLIVGVENMKRAKQFYKDTLGFAVKKSFPMFVMFDGNGNSDVGMYKRKALAKDAAVEPSGSGFRGFTMTHLVDSAEAVDAVLSEVEKAGANITRPAGSEPGGGYGGHFTDLDGNLWNVAVRD